MRHFEDEPLPEIHPHVQAVNQINAAEAMLDRHPSLSVRWPFPALDELTGPMNSGEVWFVCAFSGGGKTTFITSCIDLWQKAGKKVFVMPLETQAHRFRTYLACIEVGVHPGDALSHKLRQLPDGEAKRAAIKKALYGQAHAPYVDRVMISEQSAINLDGLNDGCAAAKSFGADVVIVDHIDHIAGGDGSNLFSESKAVNHAALQIAKENDLLLVFTSQLNLTISRNPDHLAKYSPPRVHDVFLPSIKLHVATGMIGLFRKIRDRHEHESVEDYLDKLKQARKGEIEAPEVLDTHVMGINAMKLRNYGAKEGARVYLGFENGRAIDLAEKDKWTTEGYRPRKVV